MLKRQILMNRQSGVTLVELMIGLVLGLIVTGAAISLVASISQSNSETIRATRLTQELRSLSDIIALETRRARGVKDPLANVGTGGAGPASACDIVPVPSSTCLRIGYDCDPAAATGKFRTFTFANGQMLLATDTAAPPACGAGSKLNSNDLALDAVNISSAADGSINVVLTGHLTSGANSPSRTLKRTIWPRSAAVGP
jgi:Tfp pilus assembly protein PilW